MPLFFRGEGIIGQYLIVRVGVALRYTDFFRFTALLSFSIKKWFSCCPRCVQIALRIRLGDNYGFILIM